MLINPTIMKFGGISVEHASAFCSAATVVKTNVALRPVIVKYRDEKTDAATQLEDLLR